MTNIGRTLDVVSKDKPGGSNSLLQRYFGQRDDGDEDDDARSDSVWITPGQDDVGGHFVTKFVAKHQQAYHSHA